MVTYHYKQTCHKDKQSLCCSHVVYVRYVKLSLEALHSNVSQLASFKHYPFTSRPAGLHTGSHISHIWFMISTGNELSYLEGFTDYESADLKWSLQIYAPGSRHCYYSMSVFTLASGQDSWWKSHKNFIYTLEVIEHNCVVQTISPWWHQSIQQTNSRAVARWSRTIGVQSVCYWLQVAIFSMCKMPNIPNTYSYIKFTP